MNADDFRDYMLSFLFLRYLSDNYEPPTMATWMRVGLYNQKGAGGIEARAEFKQPHSWLLIVGDVTDAGGYVSMGTRRNVLCWISSSI